MTTDPTTADHCSPAAHLHGPFLIPIITPGSWSIHLDGRSIALVHNPLIGQRICDLLNQHGLADIPDHPGWPAPTGHPVTTDKPTP